MSSSEVREAPPDTPGGAGSDPATHLHLAGLQVGGGARDRWRGGLTIAVAVAGGLLLADLVAAVIPRIQGLLVTVVVSLFLSFAMEPAVQWMARRNIRRGVGTMLVFLLAFLLLGGFVAAMAQLVVDQVRNLFTAAPGVLDQLAEQARALPGQLGPAVSDYVMRQAESLPGQDQLAELAQQIGRGALGVGTTLLSGIVQLLTALLVTFYLVADGPRLRRTLSSRLEPQRQEEFLALWELAIAKTGGYVYSRLLTAVISAAFHTVVFSAIGLRYPIALGIWVGIVSSLIPVVGTYLAGALPLVVALAQEPVTAVWVVVAIVTYQQVENYLIAPRINAATMELHPAIAFLSVLVGAALLGAAGALLALPAAAIMAALASVYGERHDVLEHGLTGDDNARGPLTASTRRADRGDRAETDEEEG